VDSDPVLDHVQIAAPPLCETEARHFYGTVIGLRELEKPAPLRARGGVWFALGSAQLHVGVEEAFLPARKAHPAIRVSAGQLDEIAARLANSGAAVRWDAELRDTRRFYTDDPWGNRLEVLALDD